PPAMCWSGCSGAWAADAAYCLTFSYPKRLHHWQRAAARLAAFFTDVKLVCIQSDEGYWKETDGAA
ncbi:MAG TPA: hypothetical protein PLA31_02115, partial [Clostridia bacterium]|nr:hypothetical protein [Clostridia bacterium]